MTWLILVIYVVIVLVLAVGDRRRDSSSDFLIAGRQVTWFATMASIVGNLRDGAGIAAWVVLGIVFGFGALWLTTGLALGLLVLALCAPIVRSVGVEKGFVTVGELIRERCGVTTARLSSAIIAGTALLYAAAQVHVSGRIFAALFGLPQAAGILLTTAIVGTYLCLGGYKTSIRTGVLQWFIIMFVVALPWLSGMTLQTVGPIPSLLSPGFMTAFAFAMLSFLVTVSSADLWQLMFSARSPNHGRTGFLAAVPVYYVISVGLVLFANALSALVGPHVNPPDVFFASFSLSSMPSYVMPVFAVFMAAAVMSTLDSQVFLFSTTVLRQWHPESASSETTELPRHARIVILLTMVMLTLLATGIGDLVQFLFGAVTLGTVLTPVLLCAVMTRTHPRPHFDTYLSIALGVGVLTYIPMFALGAFENLVLTIVPAVASSLLTGFFFLVLPSTK